MLIIFIEFVLEKVNENMVFKSLENAIEKFSENYDKPYINDISEWLIKGNYKLGFILRIINHIKNDKY
jgi:6-pyruvoyl-tetrahydropterin synthase